MRPTEYDDQDIIAAGQKLTETGRRVTGFALRKLVGGGDPKRLADVWTQHLQQHKGETKPVVELPSAIEEAIGAMGQQLIERLREVAGQIHSQAQQSADHRVKEVMAAVEAERKAAQQEVQDATETVDELETKLAEAHIRIKGTETKMVEMIEDEKVAQKQHAGLEQRLAVLEQKLEAAEAQVGKLEQQVQEATAENKVLTGALTQAEKDAIQWRARAEITGENFKTVQRWVSQPGQIDPPTPSERRPPRP